MEVKPLIHGSLCDAVGSVCDFHPEKEVTYKDLQLFTDSFSEKNRIGRTQFGILYRAKIPQGWRGRIDDDDEKYVTVKMGDTKSYLPNDDIYCCIYPEYLLARVKDEIRFLSLPFLESHQNVGKVEGYCFEENKLGVVYDVKSFDTIHNLMDDKDKFGWRNRVKVALGLARFLEHCHVNTPRYIVRNLSAAHVVVDQDFNPYLVDFAMILGGDIGDGSSHKSGVPLSAYGYTDSYIGSCGVWNDKTDVYTFGVVLLELIMKYTSHGFMRALKLKHHAFINDIVSAYYRKGLAETGNREVRCCFVNKYLRLDPDFDAEDGTELTMLALHCVEQLPHHRPSMQEVVRKLEKLHVIDKFARV
ncbi:hypothetical protein BUALT_Bualt11G0073300 [Buddleja alternifolia]|uniref:Protein kinase domain-containing protein n=1 Tax=Buddleja alternifolia TaxID=168488 RepID=A0AAV6X3W6_9LAMI|nr:hypothetical protein BUALT_Bualt11G0073300 [Buddleja alternifolia]